MQTLAMTYEGNGQFRVANRAALEHAVSFMRQGEVYQFQRIKPRSRQQHRWFFALVQAAYDNQTAGPVFGDSERLRKWLLCKANWCRTRTFPPQAMTREVAAWLREESADMDFTVDRHTGEIHAHVAKSIAYRACPHEQMCIIADKVVDIICAQIVPGTSPADWEPYRSEDERGEQVGMGRVAQADGDALQANS